MKVVANTPDRLVFEHTPVGVAVLLGIFVVGGIAAGGAAISMHERLTWDDDFVRIGAGLILASLVVGVALAWATVRARRLIFDSTASEVRLESRGLGAARVRSWPLANLRDVDVSETNLGGSRYIHATRLLFADGTSEKVGTMDPPTVQAIERNVATMRAWLQAHRSAQPVVTAR